MSPKAVCVDSIGLSGCIIRYKFSRYLHFTQLSNDGRPLCHRGVFYGRNKLKADLMTGKKSTKAPKKKIVAPPQQAVPAHNEESSSPPANVKKEQPPPPQTVKKILKTENEEAKTLKTVFKSNPDLQMKEFIKKAATRPSTNQQAAKTLLKTPADTHPPAVAQELLDTDDDVADNLCKLFKTSKSYKNI